MKILFSLIARESVVEVSLGGCSLIRECCAAKAEDGETGRSSTMNILLCSHFKEVLCCFRAAKPISYCLVSVVQCPAAQQTLTDF